LKILIMIEQVIVESISGALRDEGFKVAIEVANLYRSADVAAIDTKGDIWIIECKVTSIGRAIEQLKTHKISADKVFIGTYYRKTRDITLKKIKDAGMGLIYVMPDGSLYEFVKAPNNTNLWKPARERLLKRIQEAD